MQQELIEMLEETIQYVEVWNAHDQGIIDKAEALVEKAKKSAKEPAVPQGWKMVPVWLLERVEQSLGSFTSDEGWSQADMDTMDSVSALLAAPSQPVTLTDRQFDLICQAIDKADTITMEGDYMLDSDDCIAVVRVMQALFGIAALREKEGK